MRNGHHNWRSTATGLTALLLCTAITDVAVGAPSVYPTGVTIYDPARAYSSYVLFGDSSAGLTHLIDMDGNEVHSWNRGGFPSAMVDPATVDGKRGVIGVQVSHLESKGIGVIPGLPDVYQDKEIGFVDWDGNILWKGGSKAPGGGLHQHHDWAALPNGNVLALGSWHHAISGFGDRMMFDDVIYEMNRKGDIVWTWVVSDHLDELGFTPAQLQMIRHSPVLDYFHVNDLEVLGPNHWFKAGDNRFAPDNIMMSSRNANFTIIIDHKTGKVVWQIGPNYAGRNMLLKSDVTPEPVNQISGQHDPHMIAEGLPGAGNILLFDNQGEGGYPPVALDPLGGTRVLEIDPVKKEIVWQYSGRSSQQPEWGFNSPIVGSAQRLPNGNTLIDEGIDGRLFQVTPSGEIVWEYVSPYLMPVPVTPLPGRKGIVGNLTYRAQAVPYAWVPDGTPHSEQAVVPPALATFHVPSPPAK